MTKNMVSRWLMILALCILLAALLSGSVLAWSGSQVRSSSEALSGGGYTLTPATMTDRFLASGGSYRLLDFPSSWLAAGGCCCTYLPCIIR